MNGLKWARRFCEIKSACRFWWFYAMQIDVLNARRPTAEYLCSDKMLELSAYLKHALSERGEIRKEACIASFTYVAPSSVKTKELKREYTGKRHTMRQKKTAYKCFHITLLQCVVRCLFPVTICSQKRHEKKKQTQQPKPKYQVR